MKLVEIPFGSSLYQQELQLRDLFLRKPLGLSLTVEDGRDEEWQQHYGLLQDHILVGCVVIRNEDAQCVRLRQMVVDPGFRDIGVGSRLLAEVDAVLTTKGIARIVLHARLAVVPFYEKSGYVRQGEPFTEIGIPHQFMSKSMATQDGL